jgi:tetratricopeptide (TPR) repeat protein
MPHPRCQNARLFRRPAKSRDRSRSANRAGLSLSIVLLSLLVVALATIAVGSTVVAMRAAEQRDRAKQDLAQASDGFDDLVVAVATTVKPPRKELLQPAIDYYQAFIQSHAADKKMLPELASARFHLAALQAKLGNKDGAASMALGLADLDEFVKDEELDPATIPSLQDGALKVATPVEWFMVKDADRKYATGLVMTLARALSTYGTLSKKYPSDVNLRNNHAAVLKGWALIQSQMPGGSPKSLQAWLDARDVLETLVRDQPAVQDYQVRLVESLTNAARVQKTNKEIDQATTNMQRAVAVREQMAAAQPDNKTLQQELTTAKRELERMKPSEAPAAATAEKTAEAPPADGAKPAEGTESTTPPAAAGEVPPTPDPATPAATESAADKSPSAGQ